MNLDDLKESWKQQHSKLADGRVEELASHVLTRTSTFEKSIFRRDLMETAAAIIVMLVFGYFIQQNAYPWIAKLGMAMTMLGAIEVVAVMHWTRRHGGQPRHDLPLTEYCASEIVRVDRQIWLLRHVNWWYTGPLLLGACVFFFGILFSEPMPLHVSLPTFAALCAPILILGWMTYRINQRAVGQELLPLREELSAVSASLIDDSPATDGTK